MKIPIVFLLIILIILSACDRSIGIVGYEFGQPPRLIYIANVDTELDFYNATLFNVLRNGMRDPDMAFPPLPNDWMTVNHSIDFSTPGNYEVVITICHRHTSFYLQFYIQVMYYEDFIRLNE